MVDRNFGVKDTWFNQELPVLEAVIILLDEKGWQSPIVNVSEIAERTDIDANVVFASLLKMENEYVELQRLLTSDPNPQMVIGVTPNARRAVGQWPSIEMLQERIISALGNAIRQESDSIKKSKLQTTLDALTSLGRDIFIEVMTTTITHGIGLQ